MVFEDRTLRRHTQPRSPDAIESALGLIECGDIGKSSWVASFNPHLLEVRVGVIMFIMVVLPIRSTTIRTLRRRSL